eukprot:gene12054-12196_t
MFQTTASRVTTHAAACSTALNTALETDDRGTFGAAIVLGSGIAGLLAAQALRKQFKNVIVLEADAANSTWHEAGVEGTVSEAASGRNFRPGVGQYRQLHGLLEAGRQAMENLCPGFTAAVLEGGGLQADWFNNVCVSTPAGVFAKVDAPSQPVQPLLASRHLLEQVLRRMVMNSDGVHIEYGAKATGFLWDNGAAGRDSSQQSAQVVGVQLADGRSLDAELVVVATGRKRDIGPWLQQAGWPLPSVSQVDSKVRYVTSYFKLPESLAAAIPYQGVYAMNDAPLVPNGCYIQHCEGDVWVSVAQGYNHQWPKATWEEVMQYAKEVVYAPALHQLLQHAIPLGRPLPFYGTGNRWVHYEQAPPPEGLLVLGDAYCGFNPVYGQGMTVAALQAVILQGAVAAAAASPTGLNGLAGRFYPSASTRVKESWLLAAGRDSLCPWAVVTNADETISWANRLVLIYVANVFKTAAVDGEVSEAMTRALNMLDPPEALFKPSIVAKVVAHALTGWPWVGDKAARSVSEILTSDLTGAADADALASRKPAAGMELLDKEAPASAA